MKHYNRLYTELGRLFAEERKHNGMRQEDVANALDVSTLTVSRWERGETRIPNEHAMTLATLYEINYDEIVSKANELVLQAKANDVHNMVVGDALRVPLYKEMGERFPLSEDGLEGFITISAFLLDPGAKYFAYLVEKTTGLFKEGDILIFEHTICYAPGNICLAFINGRSVVTTAEVVARARFNTIGILRRAVTDYTCR